MYLEVSIRIPTTVVIIRVRGSHDDTHLIRICEGAFDITHCVMYYIQVLTIINCFGVTAIKGDM